MSVRLLGTDTLTYHPNGLLKTAHGGLYNTDLDRSTLATDYDMANRLIREQENIGAGLKALSYQYTPDSLVSQLTYPGGTVVARTYNTHRLLNEVKIGGVTQASHTYDTADRPNVRTYVNGTDTDWNFDANNRVTKLKHTTTGMAPVTFQEWDYRYTAADNPLVQDDVTPGLTVHGEAYTYDGLHRVGNFKRGTVAGNTVPAPTSFQTWTLSKVGDWDQWNDNGAVDTRTHNNIHALTARSVVPNPQTYDQNFSQTDDGLNYKFEYDANDMLQTVKNRVTNAVIVEYRYDALNRRVEKNVGGTITRYYLTGQRVIEERNGADATTAFYTYGDYIDCRLTMDRGGARHYYHENRMYSTYAMTDNTGAVAERYAYTAYGLLTTYNAAYGAPQTTSRLGNPNAFTGRELDNETLLYYYRARTYDPVQGRFKQLDPVEDDPNLYRYCGGNPLIYTDPTGEALTSIDAAIEKCLALPTTVLQIKCLENIIDLPGFEGAKPTIGRQLTRLRPIAECEAIWAAYKASSALAAGYATETDCAKITVKCAALTAEVAGRTAYLAKRCDYILPGSIARGSAIAEKGHQQELANKTVAAAKCAARAAVICGAGAGHGAAPCP